MTSAQPKNESAIAKRPLAAIATELKEFDGAAAGARQAFGNSQDSILSALEVAEYVEQLRTHLDDPGIRDRILRLANSPIGFLTDKDPAKERWDPKRGCKVSPEPYSYTVIRDCVIEAMLRGAQLVGNQFNIISGRCYITREGFQAFIRNTSDVKNFTPVVGVPVTKPGGAIVECSATWQQGEETRSVQISVPVKGDEKTATADQYIGKAERKLLKRCYEMMTGNSSSDGDDELPIEPVMVSVEQSTQAPAMPPELASVSASKTKLTTAQMNQLQSAMSNVLSVIGQQAFAIDACNGYGVNNIGEIDSARFSELMKNLAVDQFQDLWNQGCGVDGSRLIEEITDASQPFQPAIQATAQPSLIAEPENEL